MLTFFLLGAIAHFTGDYPLQTNWIFRQKFKSFWGVLPHSLTQTACHTIAFWPFVHDLRVVVGIGAIMVLHHIQDYVKILIVDRRKWQIWRGYVVDQIMHFLWLGIFIYVLTQTGGIPNPQITPPSLPALVTVLTLLLLTFFWGASQYVYSKAHAPTAIGEYVYDWRGMARRGGLGSIALAAIFLVLTLWQ